ncbi:hypothetical protein ccbrp13_24850 [Ktedonobacteria bacterium brp13]|nr:hypothetical protein ccbrp13_24850 [Ktedonobacteria bacterium brp13]
MANDIVESMFHKVFSYLSHGQRDIGTCGGAVQSAFVKDAYSTANGVFPNP